MLADTHPIKGLWIPTREAGGLCIDPTTIRQISGAAGSLCMQPEFLSLYASKYQILCRVRESFSHSTKQSTRFYVE